MLKRNDKEQYFKDFDAIEILFEQNYERVYRKALSILLDSELAKDATQETFVRAFSKLDTLQDKSKFTSWIYTITANVCFRMLSQKIESRKKKLSIYNNDGDFRDDLLIDFNIPEYIYEDNELREYLKACINEFDEDTRQIINLKYYNDLTIQEIAACLDMKEGTIKSRIHRAKEKVAEKMKLFMDLKG